MWTSGGLVGLLVFFAGVVLLFTGGYPKSLYDFVLGMDCWVFRVAAYGSLMTDTYPPFSLDMGGDEPPTGALRTPCRRCRHRRPRDRLADRRQFRPRLRVVPPASLPTLSMYPTAMSSSCRSLQ